MKIYKVTFYVPESHLEPVKQALFEKGAGRIGNYDYCAWQTLGTGQYRPLRGSQPFHGGENELVQLPEYQVEMICDEAHLQNIIAALLEAHPYEIPAYAFWEINHKRI